MAASGLLAGVLGRAQATLAYTSQFRNETEDWSRAVNLQTPMAVRDLLRDVEVELSNEEPAADWSPKVARGRRGAKVAPVVSSASSVATTSSSGDDDNGNDDGINYPSNPSISMIALAHSLWKATVRPGKDSVIDATAGNGGDATVLAQLLFPPGTAAAASPSHLVCIDIQETACHATRAALSRVLGDDDWHASVTIYHGSHAPLSLPPPGAAPVALVAYNLGFLPGQERETKAVLTQTTTTLASLAEAVLCLRTGGLLSVMTYPQTNSTEDAAVQAFVEGLALYSSRSQDWREFLAHDDDRYPSLDEATREAVRQQLAGIFYELGARQCWRVHLHEKLGWIQAPRLFTATRIR